MGTVSLRSGLYAHICILSKPLQDTCANYRAGKIKLKDFRNEDTGWMLSFEKELAKKDFHRDKVIPSQYWFSSNPSSPLSFERRLALALEARSPRRPTLSIGAIRGQTVWAVLSGALPVEPRRQSPLLLQPLVAGLGTQELHLFGHALFSLLESKAETKPVTAAF